MQAGRVALVTGAGRGLGFEIARQLAGLGCKVALGCRNMESGRQAINAIGPLPATPHPVIIDIDDADSVAAAVAETEARLGPIGILVNNAGVLLDGPDQRTASVLDLPLERMRQSLETNTLGALRTMQRVLPGMRQRKFGRVVNISSRAGQLEELRIGWPSYRVSKTALNSLTRVAAAEFVAEDIKINAMCPGWLRTDMGGEQAPLSAAEGARTAIWLATLPPDGPTGGFFREMKAIPW